MDDCEGAVAQGFGVHFAAHEAVVVAAEGGGDELGGVLEVTALRLEVVGTDVPALRPEDSRQNSHI